jgi:hypothetical protein
MAFDNSYTAVTGGTLSAAQWNTHVRDNFAALWPYTTAGDLAYATGATTLTRLASPSGAGLLQHSGTAPSWLSGGNALQVLRKNSANNGYEFAPIGAWAEARRTNNLTGVPDTETIVSWDGAAGQTGWKSNTRLTAPAAGDYEVSANIKFSTASQWRNYTSTLKINGTEVSISKMWSESNYIFTGVHPARVLALAAGDYLEATVDNCDGTVFAGSWMQMKRVR